jgi:hypothetical protein
MAGLLKRANAGFNGLLGRLVPNNDYGGLLTPDEAMEARRQGGLVAGASLLGSAGPQTMPTSFGQALGHAITGGTAARDQYGDQALARSMIPYRQAMMAAQIQAMQQQPQEARTPTDIAAMQALGYPLTQEGFAAYNAAKSGGGGAGATRIGESPLGKMFADLDIAEESGDVEAARALRKAIELETNPDDESTPVVNFDDLRNVRNDVIKNSEKFLDAQDAYGTLKSAAEQVSPAGDFSLTYSFFRLQDPGSRVTESEFTSMGRAGSLPDRFQAAFNQTFNGKLLDADMRADFLKTGDRQYSNYLNQHNRVLEDAREFATRHEFDVADIVPSYLQPGLSSSGGQPSDPIEYDLDPATGRLVPRK